MKHSFTKFQILQTWWCNILVILPFCCAEMMQSTEHLSVLCSGRALRHLFRSLWPKIMSHTLPLAYDQLCVFALGHLCYCFLWKPFANQICFNLTQPISLTNRLQPMNDKLILDIHELNPELVDQQSPQSEIQGRIQQQTFLPQASTMPFNQMNMLQQFWNNQITNIDRMTADDFKQHQLPLARVKKVMKSDEDVRHKMVLETWGF